MIEHQKRSTRLLAKFNKDSFRRLLKEEVGLVYTSIGSLGSSVFGALFWLILASILTVDNYGLANYYIAIATIAGAVATIGLNMTVTTFMAKGDKAILFEANSLSLVSGLIVAIVLSIFDWAAGLLSIATVFFTMSLAEALGKKNYKEYAFMQVGQKIVQICFSLFLYYIMGIMGVIMGYFIGSLFFSYKYFFSLSKFTTKMPSLKAKRDFAIHSYGYNLIGATAANYIDKIIIGALFGYFTLGLYQLGFQFFMFLSLIPTSLQQYLLPEESSGNNKLQLKILSVILSTVAAIGLFILSPYLINSFFPTFSSAIFVVQVMSIAVIPATVVAILTASFLGNEKSKAVLTGSFLYLISLVVGLVALGYFMGLVGLSITIIVSKTIQAVYLLKMRRTNSEK